MKKLFCLFLITLLCIILISCGGSSSSSSSSVTAAADNTSPSVVSQTPSNDTLVNDNQVIALQFNEEIDTASLALSGNMSGEASSGWSTTTADNDTLTISPTTTWTENATGSLGIVVADIKGNETTVNITLNIDVTSPSVNSVSPVSTSTISATGQITVDLSEDVDDTTFSLGGSFASEATVVWSDANTFIVEPTSTWSGDGDFSFSVDDLAGNNLTSTTYSYTVDTTIPTHSENPTNGEFITGTQDIVITFSETMDTGTFAYSGTIFGVLDTDYSYEWSETTVPSDTLTFTDINPWGSADSEVDRTIVVDADDLNGNSITQINLSYTVDRKAPSIVSQNHDSGDTINGSDEITYIFDETIDTASFPLGGDIWPGTDYSVTWSATSNTNDTVTFKPDSGFDWNSGSRNLSLSSIKDLVGNSSTNSDSFTVDSVDPTLSTQSPADGIDIGTTDSIIVKFSEDLDYAKTKAELGGALTANSTQYIIDVTNSNDTLFISPLTAWNAGAGTVNIDVFDEAGNKVTSSLTYTVSATEMSYAIDPPNATNLLNSGTISLVFSEAMDTAAALTLSGTLTADTTDYTWNGTTDTLTITPNTSWTFGLNKTLSVTVSNDGNGKTSDVNLLYNVVASVVHVSTAGDDDTGTGAQGLPYATVDKATDLINAGTITTPAAVHIAGGTYQNAGGTSTPTVEKSDVYLYGGFASDYSNRDYKTNQTKLESIATSGNDTLKFGDNTNQYSDIIADGLYIYTPSYGYLYYNDHHYGLAVYKSRAIIRNNYFSSLCADGSVDCGYNHYMVYVNNQDYEDDLTIIDNNTFGDIVLYKTHLFDVFLEYSNSSVVKNNTFSNHIKSTNTYYIAYRYKDSVNTMNKITYNSAFDNKGGQNYHYIYIIRSGDAEIFGNEFYRGSEPDLGSYISYGIYVSTYSDTHTINIDSNLFDTPGASLSTGYGIGVSVGSGGIVTANISNNIFYSGGGTNNYDYGVIASSTYSNISNNTFYSLNSNTDRGVHVSGGSATIENNIFENYNEALYRYGTGSTILSYSNNSFNNNATYYYLSYTVDEVDYTESYPYFCGGDFSDLVGCATTLADSDAKINEATSNLEATSGFNDEDGADNDITTVDDNDLSLTTGAIITGAKWASCPAVDFAGILRTDSCSIGAYEKD